MALVLHHMERIPRWRSKDNVVQARVDAWHVSVSDEAGVLALDTMYVNSIALIVLLGLWLDSKTYFESALLIAMLGFISTVAVCKYILRGDIIE